MKITVTAQVSELYVTTARSVMVELAIPVSGTYGMDADTVTKIRMVRNVDAEFGPVGYTAPDGTQGRYSNAEWATIVQVLKYGSNANAVNNRLHMVKSQKATALVADYANVG